MKALSALSGLAFHAESGTEFTAVEDDYGTYSYKTLLTDIVRVVDRFQSMGITATDRVAVVSKNRYEAMLLILAGLRGGPVCVPINHRLTADEIAWILRDSDARCLIIEENCLALLEAGLNDLDREKMPVITLSNAGVGNTEQNVSSEFSQWLTEGSGQAEEYIPDTEKDYLQIYTSGTSGRPKGVCLTEGNCIGQLVGVLQSIDVPMAAGQSIYQALPLFHVGGIFVSILALNKGLKLHFRSDFNPVTTERLIVEKGIDYAALVPAMIQACNALEASWDPGRLNLKAIMYGASPIGESTLKQAFTKYACGFLQVYGMTETHSVISVLTMSDHEKIFSGEKPELIKSCGRPVAGSKVKIKNGHLEGNWPDGVGEITVSSSHVMKGYWRNAEGTRDVLLNGVLSTGDIGRLEDGYLYVVDRAKDIIVSGGENISSLDVESILRSSGLLIDVAIIGMPDERWGEAVTAVLVTSSEDDVEKVADYAERVMSGMKKPKKYYRLNELPRNAGGKVLKRKLRDELLMSMPE